MKRQYLKEKKVGRRDFVLSSRFIGTLTRSKRQSFKRKPKLLEDLADTKDEHVTVELEQTGEKHMYNDNMKLYAKLLKLYTNKCGQAERAKNSENSLRYQILVAEAEAIKAELDISDV